jgi:hypothetical protein
MPAYADVCQYLCICNGILHMLDVKASNTPQRVVHDVRAIQSLHTMLVRRFAAMGGRSPKTAIPVKEPFCSRIEPVSCPQDLCLHKMCVFRGLIERLMQLVLCALAELAGLCSIAAVGVGLWLVHEDASEQDACPLDLCQTPSVH